VGVEVETEQVPIYPETRAICDALGLDPWGLIASGSLLLSIPAEDVRAVLNALAAGGVEGSVIGRVTEAGSGVIRREAGRTSALPRPARDELTRVFER